MIPQPKINLAEIQRRADAATPGEWLKGSWSGQCKIDLAHGRGVCEYTYTLHEDACVSVLSGNDHIDLIGYDDGGPILSFENAEFIANAKEDIPLLLECVRDLAEALKLYKLCEVKDHDDQWIEDFGKEASEALEKWGLE